MSIHALVAAAGLGSRMGAQIPKQYLLLQGKTVLEHSLLRMASTEGLSSLQLVLSSDDATGRSIADSLASRIKTPIHISQGGSERWQSVLSGLCDIAARSSGDDWVLVHDAARPCVRTTDVNRLIEACLTDHAPGGLLATVVSDTLKKAQDTVGGAGAKIACVANTVDRREMWAACTPQLFRVADLIAALQQSESRGELITDESSAMELAGLKPVLVPCSKDNIKITYPEDLVLAELILQAQAITAGQKTVKDRN